MDFFNQSKARLQKVISDHGLKSLLLDDIFREALYFEIYV